MSANVLTMRVEWVITAVFIVFIPFWTPLVLGDVKLFNVHNELEMYRFILIYFCCVKKAFDI